MPFTPEFLNALERGRARLRGLALAGPGGALRACGAALLLAAHALLLWTLMAGLAAPVLIKRSLALEVSAALGRSVTLESLSINPLECSLQAANFSVTGADGEPLAGFERLELNLDPLDYLAGRFAVRRFRLEKPSLRLARGQDGALNVADLLSGSDSGAARKRGSFELIPTGLRYRVADFRIEGGSVVFDDRRAGTRQELTNLRLDIESLSSDQPGLMELFSTKAELNHSRLTLTVSADLSGPAPEFQARLDARDLELRHYTPYLLPLKNPLDVVMDEAGLQARLILPGGGSVRAPRLEADARAAGVGLNAGGQRVASIESVETQGWAFDFADGSLRLERVVVQAPTIRLVRDAAGVIDLTGLLDPAEETPVREGPGQAVAVGEAVVRGGGVELVDKGLDFAVALSDVGLRVAGLDTGAGRIGSLTAEAAGDRFGRVTLKAAGTYAPLALEGEAGLDSLDLGKPLPLFKRLFPGLALSGSASARAAFRLSESQDGPAAAVHAELTLKELKAVAEGQAQPLLTAQAVAVSGVEAQYPASRVRVGQVRVSGGGAALARDERGAFPALAALGRNGQGREGQAGPDMQLDQARLENFALEYRDARQKTALRADLDEFSLQGLALGQDKPLAFAAKGRLQRQAPFELAGEARLAGPQASLKASLSELPLADVAGLVPGLPASVLSGRASLAGEAALDLSGKAPKASFKGDAGLAALKLARAAGGGAWLSLSGLAVKGLQFELDPLRVKAAGVLLEEPALSLALDKAGRPVSPLDGARASVGDKAAAPGNAASPAPVPEWGVERLEVRGGRVALEAGMVDPPLPLDVSGVELTALGAGSAAPAAVSLKFKAGEWGWGWLDGQAGLGAGGAQANVRAALENLDLSELSPLARRYTGFPVTRGKLWVRTECLYDAARLDLKNNIVASGLQLGRKSPVPGGGDVPLDLAVSLLTNAKGVIDLDIPVTGSPDAAKADLKDVISTAMAGAFARIMFSPLAFLNVGQASGDVARLGFEPGSAELSPEARKVLERLGEAVAARPRLSLEVSAYADPLADAQALAARRARQEQGQPGASQQPTPEPSAKELEALARQRRSVVMAFLSQTGKLPADKLYAVNTEAAQPPKVKGQPDARAEVRLRY